MSLKIENSRRVAKSRPVCMGLNAGFPRCEFFRAKGNFYLSIWIKSHGHVQPRTQDPGNEVGSR